MRLFTGGALPAVLATALTLILGSPMGAAEPARSLNDAVYSSPQAKAGRKLYRKHCQSCHEEAFFETVTMAWTGEALSELFSVTAAIMPQNNPGSLRDQEYLDIFAYILSSNGYPAGDDPLLAGDLDAISVQPRP